jgi:hypothetical protein
VFGMGTGVTLRVKPPAKPRRRVSEPPGRLISVYEVGFSKSSPRPIFTTCVKTVLRRATSWLIDHFTQSPEAFFVLRSWFFVQKEPKPSSTRNQELTTKNFFLQR